jgi:hypothetical protein
MEGNLPPSVIPAKAGIYVLECILDSRRSLPRTGYGAGMTSLFSLFVGDEVIT